MATKVINLQILVDDKGSIKSTTNDIKTLNKAADSVETTSKRVSNQANKTKRNLEGVSQRANRAGKDFSRLSQGMGGLVQAYATVAANVFALSTAFDVLRRAADFSSMIKSAEDLAASTGRSFTIIQDTVRDAAGGMLSLRESLIVTNKLIGVGLNTSQIETLVEVATKAAQTFGVTTTDAINRFVNAIQKGETELLKQVGVLIQLDRAYSIYAASIGTTKDNLSAFQRQQAIANAAIQEGQRQLGDVVIDPNPFEKLAVAFSDVATAALDFVQGALTPFADFLTENKTLVVGLSAAIVRAIGTRALPIIAAFGDQSLVSARKAAIAGRIQQNALRNTLKEIEKAESQSLSRNPEQALEQAQAWNKSYTQRKNFHASMAKDILIKEKELNIAVISEQRAALKREINARARGAGSAKFAGVATAELVRQYKELVIASDGANVSLKNQAEAQERVGNSMTRLANSTKKFTLGFTTTFTRLRALGLSTFGRINQAIQEEGLLSGIRTFRARLNLLNVTMAESTSGAKLLVKSFAGIAGGTAIAIGAIGKLIGLGFSLLSTVFTLKFAYEQLRDTFFPLSEAQIRFNESLEDSDDLVKGVFELDAAFAKLNTRIEKDGIDAIGRWAKFLKGSLQTGVTVSDSLRESLEAAVVGDFEELITEREKLDKELSNIIDNTPRNIIPPNTFSDIFAPFARYGREAQDLADKIGDIDEAINRIDSDEVFDKVSARIKNLITTAQGFEEISSGRINYAEAIAKQMRADNPGSVLAELVLTGVEEGIKGEDLDKIIRKAFDSIPTARERFRDLFALADAENSQEIVDLQNRISLLTEGYESLNDAAQNYEVAVNKINISNLIDQNAFNAIDVLSNSISNVRKGLDGIGFERDKLANSEDFAKLWAGIPDSIKEVIASQNELNDINEITISQVFEFNEVTLESFKIRLRELAISNENIKLDKQKLALVRKINTEQQKLVIAPELAAQLARQEVEFKREQLILDTQLIQNQLEFNNRKLNTLGLNEETKNQLREQNALLEDQISANERLSSLLNAELAAIKARNTALQQELSIRQASLRASRELLNLGSSLLNISNDGNTSILQEQLRLNDLILRQEDQQLQIRTSIAEIKTNTKIFDENQVKKSEERLKELKSRLIEINKQEIKLVASVDDTELERLETLRESLNNETIILSARVDTANNFEEIITSLEEQIALTTDDTLKIKLEADLEDYKKARDKVVNDKIESQVLIEGYQKDINEIEDAIKGFERRSIRLNINKKNVQEEIEQIDTNLKLQLNSEEADKRLKELNKRLLLTTTQIDLINSTRNINLFQLNELAKANQELRVLDQTLEKIGEQEKQNNSFIEARELLNKKNDAAVEKQFTEIRKQVVALQTTAAAYTIIEQKANTLVDLGEEATAEQKAQLEIFQQYLTDLGRSIDLETVRLDTARERLIALEQERILEKRLNKDIFDNPNILEAAKEFGGTLRLAVKDAYKDIESNTKVLIKGTINALDGAADAFADSVVNGTRGLSENIKGLFRDIAKDFLANQIKQGIGLLLGGVNTGPEDKLAGKLEEASTATEDLNTSLIGLGADLDRTGEVIVSAVQRNEEIIKRALNKEQMQDKPVVASEAIEKADRKIEVDSIPPNTNTNNTMEEIVVNGKKLPPIIFRVIEGLTSLFNKLINFVIPKPEPVTKEDYNFQGINVAANTVSSSVKKQMSELDNMTFPAPPDWNIDPILASTETVAEVFRTKAEQINAIEVLTPEMPDVPEVDISAVDNSTKDLASSVDRKVAEINATPEIELPKTPVWEITTLEEQFEESITGFTDVLLREKQRIEDSRMEDQELKPELETISVGVKKLEEPGTAQSAPDTSGGVQNILPGEEQGATSLLEAWKPVLEDMKTGLGDLLRNIFGDDFIDMVSPIFEQLGSMVGNLLQTVLGGLGGSGGGILGGLLPFANGGIIQGGIQSKIPASIPRFETGGLVSRPTVAMIGEGQNKEAIVPLPNNKEIPVQMLGPQSGDTVNITQSFDFRNADSNSVGRLRNEAKQIEERTVQRVFAEINKGGQRAKQVGRRRR